MKEKEDEPNKRNYTCFRVHMDMEMEELNGEERKLMWMKNLLDEHAT